MLQDLTGPLLPRSSVKGTAEIAAKFRSGLFARILHKRHAKTFVVPGESSEYDEAPTKAVRSPSPLKCSDCSVQDFAQALADQAALRALPTGPAFLQHLQATSGNEEKRIEAGRTRRGPLGSPSHAACD